MSTNAAVKKLNSDLSRLQHAQAAQKKAQSAETKAKAAVTTHTRQEQAALASIKSQQQAITDAFTSTTNPPDSVAQQKLLNQMYALGQKEVQTQDKYSKLISGDRATAKKEHTAASKDAKSVKADRKRALKDLKPAEYHLSLKATNKDRNELGLKALKKAVRPEIKQTVPGQVGKWIEQAQAILKAHGVPLSKMNAKDIAIIIQHESSGNPNAINNWDSNAAAGHPSEGLMQTIGPTFNAYKLPGHGKILNPVDNIIAGVRYAISRYGSISNVPGVVDVHAGRPYVGY